MPKVHQRPHPNPHAAQIVDLPETEVHAEAASDETRWGWKSDLDAPAPRSGFVQRWCRITLQNQDDPNNIQRFMRDGWRPRAPDTIPESWLGPRHAEGRFAGYIGVGDVVLCERPLALHEQQREFVTRLTEHATATIDADIRNVERPGMPIHQTRSSRVEFTRSRVPQAADDE